MRLAGDDGLDVCPVVVELVELIAVELEVAVAEVLDLTLDPDPSSFRNVLQDLATEKE